MRACVYARRLGTRGKFGENSQKLFMITRNYNDNNNNDNNNHNEILFHSTIHSPKNFFLTQGWCFAAKENAGTQTLDLMSIHSAPPFFLFFFRLHFHPSSITCFSFLFSYTNTHAQVHACSLLFHGV